MESWWLTLKKCALSFPLYVTLAPHNNSTFETTAMANRQHLQHFTCKMNSLQNVLYLMKDNERLYKYVQVIFVNPKFYSVFKDKNVYWWTLQKGCMISLLENLGCNQCSSERHLACQRGSQASLTNSKVSRLLSSLVTWCYDLRIYIYSKIFFRSFILECLVKKF